jgi:hypothetical protein
LVGGAALRLLMDVGIIIISDEKFRENRLYLPTRVTEIAQLFQCQPKLNCTKNNTEPNERMDGQASGGETS